MRFFGVSALMRDRRRAPARAHPPSPQMANAGYQRTPEARRGAQRELPERMSITLPAAPILLTSMHSSASDARAPRLPPGPHRTSRHRASAPRASAWRALRFVAVSLLAALLATQAAAGNGWSDVREASAGPARVVGSYSNGCVAGAQALPLIGEGFQVMRPSRHRYFGHPKLLDVLQRLGQVAAASGRRMLVGDLSQPRGGPLLSGHRSHQVGLDVDVWFLMADRVLSAHEAENWLAPSMVRAADGVMADGRWQRAYRDLLKAAAEAAEVERIFVNPIIKRALCDGEADKSWLAKVRPWWNHEEHFHARLFCPAGDGDCEAQASVPPGHGCDGDLDHWVADIQAAARAKKRLPPPPPPSTAKLPSACAAILDGD